MDFIRYGQLISEKTSSSSLFLLDRMKLDYPTSEDIPRLYLKSAKLACQAAQ